MQPSPQPQGGYQQQAPQQNYQQQQPQGGYQQQMPQQQQYQQQPAVPGKNWEGKEGMATGMAIPAACRLANSWEEVPMYAARILLLQQEMMEGMMNGGEAYLMQLCGLMQQQPAQQPAPQQQAPDVPQPQYQQAPQQQQQQMPQPSTPASMVPQGFDAPPPQ